MTCLAKDAFEDDLLFGAVSALGTELVAGMGWPAPSAGVAMYAGPTPNAIDFGHELGFAFGKPTSVQSFDWVNFEPDSTSYLALRKISAGGVLDEKSPPEVVILTIDGDGDDLPQVPAPPTNVTAKRLAGGKFEITFSHHQRGPNVPAAKFEVFAGVDGGEVDYETPLVDSVTGLVYVPAKTRQSIYEFTTAGYDHGTMLVFGVRALSADGDAEQNTATTTPLSADAEGAALHETWSFECR